MREVGIERLEWDLNVYKISTILVNSGPLIIKFYGWKHFFFLDFDTAGNHSRLNAIANSCGGVGCKTPTPKSYDLY